MRRVLSLLFETGSEFQKDNGARLAAALAYYTIFSLAPLLVIFIAIAGRVVGEQAARGELVAQLEAAMGGEAAQFVQQLIAVSSDKGQSGIAASMGLVVLLYGATRLFVQLKDALNSLWQIPPPAVSWMRALFRDRLVSFLVLASIGALVVCFFLLNTAAAAALGWFSVWIEIPAWVLLLTTTGVSLLFTTAFCAVIYKILPDCVVPWRNVWLGALIAAVLYAAVQALLRLYFVHSAMSSTYGAAGALVVILIWANLAAQILLLGAEVTQVQTARTVGRVLQMPQGPSLRAKLLPFNTARRIAGAVEKEHTIH